MKNRLTGLLHPTLTDEAAAEQYQINDNSMWSLSEARKRLRTSIDFENICTALYRPFDHRVTYFDHDVIFNQRLPVTKHIFARDNKCLLSTRMTKGEDWQHLFISTKISDCAALSNSTSTNAFSLPLWVYVGKSKIPNLSPAFLVNLRSALTLTPADYRPDDATAPLHADKIFHYIYAVLHSRAYRQRYAAFLRTDFPRIPIPGSLAVFNALAELGSQLVAWHLLEHPDAIKIEAVHARSSGAPAWFGKDFSLIKVAEKGKELAELTGTTGMVFINATSGFANLQQPIWQHTIGGYQVLHKWLDDRRKAGRSLSQHDITHWLRIYASLQATQALMLQVDAAIEANGGWPGAFSQNHPPPDAATLAAEQMVQKDQLKAQKKAATATKKRAAYASPTGASSLFDDDLDGLVAASGNEQ
jgi:predicted helicase